MPCQSARQPGRSSVAKAGWPSRTATARAEAELKHDLIRAGLQGGQERFIDIRGVTVALGGAGLIPSRPAGRHFVVRDRTIVDVGRQMGRRRHNLPIRDARHIVGDRLLDVVERLGSAGRSPAVPHRRSARGCPASFPSIARARRRRVILAPLTRVKKPHSRAYWSRSSSAPVPGGQLGTRPAESGGQARRTARLGRQPVRESRRPASSSCVRRSVPSSHRVREDDPDAPEGAGVGDIPQIRQRLLIPGVSLGLVRPAWETESTAPRMDMQARTGR